MEIIGACNNTHQAMIFETVEIEIRHTEICNEELSIELPWIWKEILGKQKCETPDGTSTDRVVHTAPLLRL